MNAYKLSLYSLGFALLFGALCYVTYFPPKDGAAALVAYLYGALGTLAGHILGSKTPRRNTLEDAPPAGLRPAAPRNLAQGGFVSLPLLMLVVYAFVLAFGASVLTGCAGLNAQGVLTITYNTPATLTSATLSPGGLAGFLAAPAPLPAASAPAAPASAAK